MILWEIRYFQQCDVISKCAKVIFFGIDFQKGKKNIILDPQNRDDRVDLRVFGEVWAWIDVFMMLISYQYSIFSWRITNQDLTKFHIMMILDIMIIHMFWSGFQEKLIKNDLGPPKSIRESNFKSVWLSMSLNLCIYVSFISIFNFFLDRSPKSHIWQNIILW